MAVKPAIPRPLKMPSVIDARGQDSSGLSPTDGKILQSLRTAESNCVTFAAYHPVNSHLIVKVAANEPAAPAVVERQNSITSIDRKRRLSRDKQDSVARRPRPPPLSSKSSSAVPTLSTTEVDISASQTVVQPPHRSTSPFPRSWLGRSTATASMSTGVNPHSAADLLRQAMMHRLVICAMQCCVLVLSLPLAACHVFASDYRRPACRRRQLARGTITPSRSSSTSASVSCMSSRVEAKWKKKRICFPSQHLAHWPTRACAR